MRVRLAVVGALFAGLVASAATSAGARVTGGVSTSVPAPAVGQGAVQEVDGTFTGSSFSVGVANLAQLGKGFGGVAIVHDPKVGAGHSFQIYLVMYMGNLSKSPATSVQLKLPPTARVTRKSGKAKHCDKLAQWNDAFENGSSASGGLTLESLIPPGKNESPPESFLDSMLSFMWGSCPGKPEAQDAGDK
jgi:hypothetical protein